MALDYRAAEPLRELPADPWVFGVVALGLLLALLMVLLMFGKGRHHS